MTKFRRVHALTGRERGLKKLQIQANTDKIFMTRARFMMGEQNKELWEEKMVYKN